MSAANLVDESTHHACSNCGVAISNRYPFPDCTRCAIEANKRNPEVLAWRAAKRAAAYERLERAGLTNAGGATANANDIDESEVA
jgi:hypothetical protein